MNIDAATMNKILETTLKTILKFRILRMLLPD